MRLLEKTKIVFLNSVKDNRYRKLKIGNQSFDEFNLNLAGICRGPHKPKIRFIVGEKQNNKKTKLGGGIEVTFA